jgi:hypothetical protein
MRPLSIHHMLKRFEQLPTLTEALEALESFLS